MYGKIFDSMYDGTLVDDWRALITFQQMIILCDADGVVDMTPASISRRTGIPIDHIKTGLEILENPDPYSRTPAEDGRRIALLDEHRPWGWYIVNHAKYKTLQDKDTVREQNRLRKQKQRARHAESQPVTDDHTPSLHTDTDTDINIYVDFDRFWNAYPKKDKKKDAKRIWLREKLDSLADTIIGDIKGRLDSGEWKDKKYIPYPPTYLNGERWNDEGSSEDKPFDPRDDYV